MLKIEFATDNAAFTEDSGPECARILREIARDVEHGVTEGTCIDINGNKVGEWSLVQS